MTLREVARWLRVSPGTVYRLVARNQIPALRLGRNFRFSRDAITHATSTQVLADESENWIAG